ncbi:MAG: iron ABC transporter permease [Proteobacteria bacterium]|nr:iron ABC transporter permease [Pseudomonadota bacterium]
MVMQVIGLIGAVLFLGAFLVAPVASVLGMGLSPQMFGLLFSSPRFWDCLLNSINLGLGCTILTVILALPLALVTSRYRLPLHGLIQATLLLPMLLPPFVGAIGLRKLLSRFGPINLLLMNAGITDQPVDFLGSAGLAGVALVQALHLYPILYLSLAAAISRLDSSLDDAGALSGATPLQRLTRITIPLLVPSLFGGGILVFSWSLTDLGTPLIFDYRSLLSVRIFEQADEISSNPLAYTLVSAMALLCAALFATSQLVKGKDPIFTGTKGTRPTSPRALRGSARVIAVLCIAVFAIIATAPHLSVILLSISPSWFMTALPTTFSFEAYTTLLSHPLTATSIKNSTILSLASTAINLVLGISIAWLLARGTIRGRKFLDYTSMLPLAIPGVVLAFGYLDTFAGTMLDARVNPLPLLVLGYAVRRLPFMLRSVDAGFAQCDRSLEEAASTFGATPATVVRRITIPILAPQLIAGAILCFCLAMLEVSESLILAQKEQYYPISKAMYALLARPDGDAIASALGVATMAVILLGFWIASRVLNRPIAEILRP